MNKAANDKTPQPTSADILARKKPAEYEEFILWFAMPPHEKRRLGLETQKQFGEYHNVDETTMGRWKKRKTFYPRLKEIRDIWAKDRTQDVIAALYRGAISDSVTAPKDREIWLKYVEGWSEKTTIEQVKKVELTVHDIRFWINTLPDPYKQRAYDDLRNIIDLIAAYGPESAVPADSEAGAWSGGDEPARALLEEADHDAQNVPDGQQPDAVAESDPRCLRRDLEWSVQPRDHQSTARWW